MTKYMLLTIILGFACSALLFLALEVFEPSIVAMIVGIGILFTPAMLVLALIHFYFKDEDK